jgi:ABC-type hemin transport system substrate-binding protein
MIIGKHEETIEVNASRYVEITVEEDGIGNAATILLFPEQAEKLIAQIQKAIEEVQRNRSNHK